VAKGSETRPADGFAGSSFKYTPLQHLRVLFIQFAQGLFGAAPPGNYHWSPDINTTEIVIQDDGPIHAERLQSRPGITFTRSAVQLYSAWIDDMMWFDFRTETKTKSVLVPGTMSINCCSRSDIESEAIAWVLAEHFWLLRELMMKVGFFDIGRQVTVSAPSPAGSIVQNDQGDEWICTTVAVPFQFYRTSAFTPLGRQIVNNIELSIDAAVAKHRGGGPAIPTHEFPLAISECFPPSFAPDATDTYGRTPNPEGREVVRPPTQPHPLNPSKMVHVRVVRPGQPGRARVGGGPYVLPIRDPCKGESGT
jgi:hypothetical protein